MTDCLTSSFHQGWSRYKKDIFHTDQSGLRTNHWDNPEGWYGPWHFVEICTQTLFQVGLGASSDEQAMVELNWLRDAICAAE